MRDVRGRACVRTAEPKRQKRKFFVSGDAGGLSRARARPEYVRRTFRSGAVIFQFSRQSPLRTPTRRLLRSCPVPARGTTWFPRAVGGLFRVDAAKDPFGD